MPINAQQYSPAGDLIGVASPSSCAGKIDWKPAASAKRYEANFGDTARVPLEEVDPVFLGEGCEHSIASPLFGLSATTLGEH